MCEDLMVSPSYKLQSLPWHSSSIKVSDDECLWIKSDTSSLANPLQAVLFIRIEPALLPCILVTTTDGSLPEKPKFFNGQDLCVMMLREPLHPTSSLATVIGLAMKNA